MPSSISSSDALAPRAPWPRIFATAFALVLLLAGGTELVLRRAGYAPTAQDDAALWARAREKANHPDALVLIGASRMLLDADLATMRAHGVSRPVQLAIDGASYLPVLEDLAADESFRGRVLVDHMPHVLAQEGQEDLPRRWVAQARRGFLHAPSAWTEARLGAFVRSRLAAFADGATPLSSWRRRLLGDAPDTQYIETTLERERFADYRRVPMPRFAYERALRHIGRGDLADPGATAAQLDRAIAHAVAEVAPQALDSLARGRIARVARAVDAIVERGGAVAFVRLPTSGTVAAYDARRFPDETWLAPMLAEVRAPWLDAVTDPGLGGYTCPDGSHLDRRDRARFTAALMTALERRKALPGLHDG